MSSDRRPPIKGSSEKNGKVTPDREAKKYVLRLYVSGATQRSTRAIANIKKICEAHLKGLYELEVIDLYKRPDLAKAEQIVAAPTLVKKLPTPLRKFIGDLSDTERILVGLELIQKEEAEDS